MPDSSRPVKSRQEILQGLSEGLFRNVCRVGSQGNTLEIRHGFSPRLAPELLHDISEIFGVSVSLDRGREQGRGQRLNCDTAALPFPDRAFSLVLLHHVVEDGGEAELSEAVRVLARDGTLVLLGLNRNGWRFRTQAGFRALPGMSPVRIKNQLDRLGMSVQQFAGSGLLNRETPTLMEKGLSSLALPLADVMLLSARHKNGPEVSALRFRKLRSGVVQSASLSG